jgi:hypothetical protein
LNLSHRWLFQARSVGTHLRHRLHQLSPLPATASRWVVRLKGCVFVTIYSHHPSRGKVQILATYSGSAGITSSTVTSVDDVPLATPIVDALNRISALATVPVSVWDTRDGYSSYPAGHLAALTDRSARVDLLSGAHSLWYELVKLLLHKALTDLDDAMAAVPGPVGIAIDAELEAEARGLREALAEYSEGTPPPEADNQRCWDFESPFVAFDGGIDALSGDTRKRLNDLEEGISAEQRQKGVVDLRLLVDAYERCVSDDAMLEITEFTIFDEPDEEDRYYLSVDAPHPDGDGPDSWRIQIGRWVPDDPADAFSSATGDTLLYCARSVPPASAEIVELLNRSAGQPGQVSAWAQTPVGDALAGTTFVVTEHVEGGRELGVAVPDEEAE